MGAAAGSGDGWPSTGVCVAVLLKAVQVCGGCASAVLMALRMRSRARPPFL